MHTQPTETDHGPSLRTSRRLDWRFLLPDPTLNTVALIGREHGALANALRAFSNSLDVIGRPSQAEAGRRAYDVVALENPSNATFAHGAAMLRPGGWLYAEFRRRLVGTRLAGSYRGMARTAGLTEVSVHWHWPTFDACTRIVTLDEAAPFAFLLTRGHDDAAARARAIVARAVVGSGGLALAARCVSVIGHRPA